jgi:hypothetical protein
MLMVGIAKQVPQFKSTLKDIYPRFVDDGGGEMHVHLGEYGYSLHLTSTENGVQKSIRLPLEMTEPAKYLRHLWSYNTIQLPYTPLPDDISRALREFHSMPRSERPKYFSVRDDRDRVLKWVTEHVETTQGGAISLEEAREIVLKAMVEVGVLPQNARDEELIYFLSLSDYSQEVAALKPPKKPKVKGKAKKKHEDRKPLSSTTRFESASATVEVAEKVNSHHPAVVILLPALLFLLGLLLGYFIF